ncbi:GNAT family N-acetyltransferase [Planococcus sp. CAU13]|uniref:GNAT family N-acetyltransferase n=1 Tax=Planococcus sp. CAU13 TaxID=1541197 RepID=UPI00052FEAD4|nr:GNAT family N-acetyltransferase [Planococcus sp. CAU13]
MNFTSEPMTEATATLILKWRYPYPYDFYNNELNDESMSEMLEGTYRAVRNETGDLFGFYCIGNSAQVPAGRIMGIYPEGFIDFGLGMRPAETGQGKGSKFFTFVHEEIVRKHPDFPLRLTAATFNKRAIRLYENFGFIKIKDFKTDFAAFQTMVQDKDRSRLTESK